MRWGTINREPTQFRKLGNSGAPSEAPVAAYLALIHERAERRRSHRLRNVRVIQNNDGSLAPEFQKNGLQVTRSHLRNDTAHARRPGKTDLANC